MTHKDIYTKFMIEYDKANVTSSYPSLTEYEVATVLDKAYNALIAQKVSGNNVRRTGFESDLKSISDLQPLIMEETISTSHNTEVKNMKYFDIPEQFLYFVDCNIKYTLTKSLDGIPMDEAENTVSADRILPVKLVTHQMAEGFFESAYNMPWVKQPVCFIENNKLNVVYDSIKTPIFEVRLGFIKKPNTFVKDLTRFPAESTFFDGAGGRVTFECNPTMAEELISLAVAFALENVESQRLNAKLNMRGLEA